ncbi:hypothetical protein V6N13_031511 [Hibiscus sabdariffa]|uniref:Enoyl-CoA hydratase n=1 Tax=Hibiscus sabdariffa TaxID=183260 RepID=A0ABR2CK29_9ROSI
MEDKYGTLKITQESSTSGVFNLIINRPSVSNALSLGFFTELPKALAALDQNPSVSVIVLSGSGNHFCGGLTLKVSQVSSTVARLITAARGSDYGDKSSSCKMRSLPSRGVGSRKDAFFSVKEVDVAITADLGTLQRLPGIVGFGNAMELSLTARRFSGDEAKELGLVSRVFGSREELMKGVLSIAEGISGKPPLAVVGTKAVLIRSRDLNVEQGLDYVATWNSSMLLSDDLTQAISAQIHKRKPTYAKL